MILYIWYSDCSCFPQILLPVIGVLCKRWEAIANFLKIHITDSNRSAKDVLAKAKQLQKNGRCFLYIILFIFDIVILRPNKHHFWKPLVHIPYSLQLILLAAGGFL